MGSNAAEEESTLIAIDSDQNSQHAVKWAVEYLFRNNSSCTLLHVRTKNLYHNDLEVFPKQGRPPTEEELQQIFLPFRGFCARKRVLNSLPIKELVLQDTDVVNALTNYIILNSINNVVVGASRSNALLRSKSSKKPPTTKHENIRQEEGDMHEEEERNKPSNEIAPNKVLFKRYNIREIEIATNYFNNALKIGEGSYGPVFKGVLDNIVVAVKALRPDITHGEKQFQQEPPMGVAHFVQEGIEKGTFSEVLDPNVMDWPVEDTLSFAKLALKCCEMRKRDRPDLASVILPELSRLTNLGVVITFPKDKIMV
ncbi:U-box domain-containing protein [Vigna angularis]|uniref:RING-type E3 ubiquitin transferase n=1 Tax=Phaseolus angularis TaxID=3914 RepID=A0A8T0JEL7_PHAAN|nr:U-box domain-containing protein [Vigna angularis]